MNDRILSLIDELKKEIVKMKIDEKVETLNKIRATLKEVSPFVEPVDMIEWVKVEDVQANEYNPNKVATPEMKLLYESIKLDGYTQPIVTYKLENGKREVVDGFHRNRILKEHKDIAKRTYGYLPVTTIEKPIDERMASTIRHNRARGTHQIRSMSEIVIDLTKEGWPEEKVCKELGMELDEVIRLKQISGLKEAFSNHSFSKSWEEFEKKYYDVK
ncbi:MAG: ParB/RepB/Spo0J family partition protein [Anaerocolumna aminovalerica]|uniref:IbrB-like domain-containing protein n=1 Tax=Anaerocolumna aminovalerica TaxID=1527 RepID=UPI0029138750|nr:ParB/RepB/Spo0J family partition protein [Anaerocolumna aminovalerica]MDU6263745.1 ParB/RepB/Spo0J family partition protein [Anaerocolumna aminovalerica]